MADAGTAAQPDVRSPTLRTFALAAIAECAAGRMGSSVEAAFLRAQWERCGARSWRERLSAYAAAPSAVDQPLVALAHAFRLSPVELIAAALCAAVEDDVMVSRVLAAVQAPLGGSRPTVALLTAAMAGPGSDSSDCLGKLANGVGAASGLLMLLGEREPLPERQLATPLHVAHALTGRDGHAPGASVGCDPGTQVIIPPSIAAAAQRQAAALAADPATTLIIRGASRAEGHTIAHAIASALARRPLFITAADVAGLAAWAFLRRLLPVFVFDLGPGDRRCIRDVPSHRAPVVALCGYDGMVEAGTAPCATWTIPVPPPDERRALWRQALGNDGLADRLARDHRHGAGRIFHLGRLARHHARVDGRSIPERPDVLAASWTGETGALEALAQPLRQPIPDDALVATPALREQLELLVRRCRARDRLGDRLGASIGARYQPGVRALFVGPSGTGKTLAVGWLATRLALPLYRVDLAAVTSKYIGETEKNLAQLLALAEQSEVLLLFDEADAMFGRRTDVRDANDRFANAQTNYLLQRIETFDGISILTSNSRSRFDDAFSRRLDMVVEFSAPGPEERRALWMSHLGTNHRLDTQAINQLSALADLSGGDIRNAVLAAAVLADDGERSIDYDDVVIGIAGEYRKSGRQMPLELRRRA